MTDATRQNSTREIRVDYLPRVEGEGSLRLRVAGGRVEEVQLAIFEPPRFFEGFLRGRHYTEAPDITARICGICPVAYQMSAVHAMENALGIAPPAGVRELRRLIYCGEWIASHALHITMLHAPDFLGYPDAIAMAADHPQAVERGLALKAAGNAVMALVGGREVHPINVRVGGFHRVPRRAELRPLAATLEQAREHALALVEWTATLPAPDFEADYLAVALRHRDEYPLNEGRIVSTGGLDIAAPAYDDYFEERHLPYTTALHSLLEGERSYLVGPLARYTLNYERLPALVREAAESAGVAPPVRNPFRSIVVRALEVLFAIEEALRLIAEYEQPARPFAEAEPRVGSGLAGTGYAVTEAPRGLLYHRYTLDEEGTIVDAKIVPPTSQNQRAIEEDLAAFAAPRLDLPGPELTHGCEQLIRSFDPCISCATHFLDLTVERR